MKTKGNMVTLSKKEVNSLIDRECKKSLRMTIKEFLEKRENGGLPKSPAVHDIEILLNLV